jgi:hypothetical protein
LGWEGEQGRVEPSRGCVLCDAAFREFSLRILVLPSWPMRDGSYYEFWVYILTSQADKIEQFFT